jgi:hypothetical protein
MQYLAMPVAVDEKSGKWSFLAESLKQKMVGLSICQALLTIPTGWKGGLSLILSAEQSKDVFVGSKYPYKHRDQESDTK